MTIKKHRTCHELGECQRNPECLNFCAGSCEPKAYPFAPGVIEGPAPGTNKGWVVELVALAIAVAAVVAALGFASGYLGVPEWL